MSNSALTHIEKTVKDIDKLREIFLMSPMSFLRTFFEEIEGEPFEMPPRVNGSPSYIESIVAMLEDSFHGRLKNHNLVPKRNLLINIPPRHSKTTLIVYFAAWCYARNPGCNFIYGSAEKGLSSKNTKKIRDILTHPSYTRLFPHVRISNASSAKDDYETSAGGSMFAVGVEGGVIGRGAGRRNSEQFGGAFIIDDIMQFRDAFSDTIREKAREWVHGAAKTRRNNPTTPIWSIAQRLHEIDPYAMIRDWDDTVTIKFPAIDKDGNILNPSIITRDELMLMKNEQPYVFWSQYMQEPQPSGGGLFAPEDFPLHDTDPKLLRTFITVDTAETDKTYNDATVFSFWGIYKISRAGVETNDYAIHWLDCHEVRVEPKDLEAAFYGFYSAAMRHKIAPDIVAIEKKSTGTTLISVLKQFQGIRILEIERNRGGLGAKRAYSKIDRFIEMQPYISRRQISFTRGALHHEMCVEHMRKIVTNNTHAHDDIADTCQMAIQCVFLDKVVLPMQTRNEGQDKFLREMNQSNAQAMRSVSGTWG